MPDRRLRAGILMSRQVDALSVPAELFYRRLMSVVDDFGRCSANLADLRVACYPKRVDRVREADISRWLAECQTAGLIALYEDADKNPLLVYLKVEQPRAKFSQHAQPPAGIICWRTTRNGPILHAEHSPHDLRAHERTCAQMRPNANANSNSNTNPPQPPRKRGARGSSLRSPKPNLGEVFAEARR